MGWITAGATSLVERSRDVTVLHEIIQSGNAIVYSLAAAQVATLDGSLVAVATSTPQSDLLELTRAATLLVERQQTASTLQELS